MKKLWMAVALIAVLSLTTLAGLGGGTSTFAAAACAPLGSETISTDKVDYAPEETVIISGSSFSADCDLMVRVTRPDGSIVTGDGTFGPWPAAYDAAATDPDGNFTFNYILDGITGLYTVDILDDAGSANVLATTTFSDAVSGTLTTVANGAYTSWTGDEADIDEGTATPDCGSADSIISTGTNNRESFTLSLTTIPDNAVINSVTITLVDRGDSVAGGTYKTFARLNGIDTDAAADLTATGGSGDPCSGIKTQVIDVQDIVKGGATTLEIGAVKTGTNTNVSRVGAMTAVVTYTMSSAGPQSVTSSANCIDDASVGTVTWTSPGNAQASDDVKATASLGDNAISHYIKCTGFGFAIPTGATIAGVVATIERSDNHVAASASAARDSSVRLVKAGTIVGSNLGTATDYTATDFAEAHGSDSNLWGTTWTPAEINASNFGVVYAAFKNGTTGGNITVSADQITLTVYYAPNAANFNVAKDFSDNASTVVTMGLSCTSGTVTATDATATETPADTANFIVVGFTSSATCTATETAVGGYTANQAACAGVALTAAGTSSCTITNTLNSAQIHVAKDFSDNAATVMTIGLTCTSGTITVNDATATDTPADTADFTITGFNSAGTTCTATETVPPGYTANQAPCATVAISQGSNLTCTITNTLNSAQIHVAKDFSDNSGSAVTIGLTCTSGTVTVNDATATDTPADTADFTVTGFNSVGTTCTATESAPGGYTANQAACAGLAISQGSNLTCTITNSDTTAPVVTCGATIIAEATGPTGATVTWAASKCSAVDAVSGSLPCSYSPPSGSLFGLGSTTVTCTATDASGNIGTGTFLVTVVDTTAPVVTCGADITAEATGPSGAAVSWAASHCSSLDAVDGATACSYNETSGDTFGLGTTTVTCSYTDAAGNGPSSDSFDIIVQDTTAPVVTCGADITAEATGPSGAAVSWAASHCSSLDAVDGATACSYNETSGDTFGLGTTTVTCSYTDAAGNGPSSDSFDIIVQDTTAPVVTCGADITAEATGPSGAAVSWAASHCSSLDAVDGATACSYNETSGDTFGLGTTTVTCSYTDAAGNGPSSDSFDIIVQDTTAPVVTCGADITAEATGPSGAAVSWAASHCSSLDAVDGATACSYNETSGDTFGLGTTTVTCSYTDAAGNGPSSDSFDIIVQDTTAPVVTCGADITAEATGPSGAAVSWAASHCSSLDAVDGATACSYNETSGDTFGLGTTTVTCSYTDAAGNGPSSDSFDIIVQDTTAPVVTCGADITAEATGPSGAAVSWAASHCSSLDAVDGATACSYNETSGDTFGLGTTTVTCSYTDAAGNGPSSDSFDIIVQDTTAPVVTCGADITAEATGPSGAAVSWAASHCSSLDAVDGATACSYNETSGDTFGLGTTTVTCSYTDAAGNGPSSDSFDIIVQDTTAPVVTCGADITAEATGPSGAAVSWAASHCSSLDAVDGATACSYNETSGDTFGLGTTTVTCSYTDAAGNGPSSDSFDIIVQDTTAPVVTCGADITAEATGPSGAAVSWAASHCSSLDAVDGATACSYNETSGDTFGLGTTTVTCSYTDAAGNGPSSDSFDIIVQDTTAPVVTCGADITAEATGPSGAAVSWAASHCSSLDAVDGATACSYNETSGDTFGLGTTTVTCSYTDAAGNGPSSDSFDIIVQDTTAPVVTCGADITAEATGPSGAAVSWAASHCSSLDAVDGATACSYNETSGDTFGLGTTTVTCSYTDAAGNGPSSDSFDIIVQDTTAPVVTCGADITAEATGPSGAAVSWAASHCSSLDAVDGATACSYNETSGDTFGLGTTTVTCSYTDAAGNGPSSDSFDIIVQDTTAPVVTCGADITAEATGPSGAAVSWAASHCSSLDAVDGATACSYNETSGDTFGLGTTTVTCSYTDAAGNGPSSDSFDIIVQDTTAPVVTCGADITAEATGPSGAAVSWAASHCSSLDAVDGATACSYNETSGDTFGLGTTTVTCSYTDAAGNGPSSDSFDIIVQDTTAPVVTCGADITAEATGPSGAAVSWAASHCSSLDAVDGATACSYNETSGDTFGLGTTTVTCSYTDAAGNGPSSDSFDIIVQDTTAPVVTCGADITAEATGPSGAAVSWAASHCSSLDAVDGATACSYNETSGDTFGLGTTTVTCSYTDAAGNGPSSDSFDIIVQDTTAPVVTCGADITAEATGPSGAAVSWAASHCSSLDAVDGATACSYNETSGDTFGLGTTTVTCSYTDAAGNGPSSDSFDIIVQDTTAPVVTCGADITAEATGPSGAAVSWAASHCSSLDAVDGATACSYNETSGDTFGLGTTTVTCSYTDAAGNGPSSDSFDIIVQDTTAPVVTCGADITAEATGPSGAAVSWAASKCTATDLVDGGVACSYGPASGSLFPLGNTTVTCTATDAHANSGTASFVVHVVDTTPPTVTCGPDITVQATGPTGATATWAASKCTATDLVDGGVACSYGPASGSLFPLGNTTVTCTATDAHANSGTATFVVHVVDTTPPTVTCGADITVAATSPSGAAVSISCTATDAVAGSLPVTCVPASGSVFPIGTTTAICTATDGFSNSASDSVNLTVTPMATPAPPECIGMIFDNIFTGTANGEVINGTAQRDLILGLGGNDVIYGMGGDDCISGGDGNDVIYADAGNDRVLGGAGNDTVYGGNGNDVVYGGTGNDVINGDGGNDVVYGGDNDDVVNGGAGADVIYGEKGNDVLNGEGDADVLDGGVGDDVISGGEGNDVISGGDGADRIDGGNGNDTIDGGKGNDILCGGNGNDTMQGGDGNDTIYGGAGNDTLLGGAGNDTLVGGDGSDTVAQNAGSGSVNTNGSNSCSGSGGSSPVGKGC